MPSCSIHVPCSLTELACVRQLCSPGLYAPTTGLARCLSCPQGSLMRCRCYFAGWMMGGWCSLTEAPSVILGGCCCRSVQPDGSERPRRKHLCELPDRQVRRVAGPGSVRPLPGWDLLGGAEAGRVQGTPFAHTHTHAKVLRSVDGSHSLYCDRSRARLARSPTALAPASAPSASPARAPLARTLCSASPAQEVTAALLACRLVAVLLLR